MSFLGKIHQLGNNISFSAIRNIANDFILSLPRIEQDKLYSDLVRGTAILDDEPHLNKYLQCYGAMHKAKLDEAFSRLPHINELFAEDIELYDWGCGQGIATICLLDYLRSCKIVHHFKRINLIEPSGAALNRTKDILSCYNESREVELRIVQKKFDELNVSDVDSLNCRKLHLFSNILDVASFDLAKFTQLFQQSQKGGNYIVCVGPLNAGYRRADLFIDALNVQHKFVNYDKPKGCWHPEGYRGDECNWTISLRIFATFIESAEDIAAIQKRIDESQKHRQFFAGYVTDAVSDVLDNSEYKEQAEELLASLSTFDVRSDKSLDHDEIDNPILAVMSNIISRGMPTRASLNVEKKMAEHFSYSLNPLPKEHHYSRTEACKAEDVFNALHLIDPRFKTANYNERSLDSSFEFDFINKYLPQHDCEYLCQVLEPQRELSSIVDIPNRCFNRDRRVDFALEVPYSTEGNENHIGFVVEVNGVQYHSSMVSRIKDARREALISERRWDVNTLLTINDASLVNNWENNNKYSSYLKALKRNFNNELKGDWLNLLQFVLSPFAVARIEKTLVEAIISGYLDLSAESWSIAVIERDVPCAQMAIDDIRELYNHLCQLKGTNEELPSINLSVISTSEFVKSPLHGSVQPNLNQNDSSNYDLCIDISVLLRDKIAYYPISIKANTYYVIRSSHYCQDVRKVYSANSIEYAPLVLKTQRGEYDNIPGRGDVLTYFLQNIFRKDAFREGQLAILSRALANQTTIGLLPTGGGKSLTYQLAALLQPGVTIIVDPLVSLMVDQYEGLVEQRIDASACINSTMTREEKTYCLGRMQSGEIQFMFLSPERFMMEDFREEILAMPRNNGVFFAYGVIDEVHTVSEWGHDFRPAYLQLGRNMTRFMETKSGQNIPIIGLTATASFDVLADVERELTLGGAMALNSDAIVRPEISEREELTYRIVEVKADFSIYKTNNANVVNANSWDLKNCVADAKRSYLRGLLMNIPLDLDTINSATSNDCHLHSFKPAEFYYQNSMGLYDNAGIIFCPYREGKKGVLDKVIYRNNNIVRIITGIATYVASLDPSYKVCAFVGGMNPIVMKPFIQNERNVMVATKAFGMGIDKPNVRFTINITHPSSIESYVQEAGRGGRDKKIAISYLLFETTQLIELSVENLFDVFGQNIPVPFIWLSLYTDQFVEWSDLKSLCAPYGLTVSETQQLEGLFSPYRMNVDKDVQLYFHNNSFKGSFKERVILAELAYGVINARNLPQNNGTGVVAAMNGLNTGNYSYVDVYGENDLMENYEQFRELIINEANKIALTYGWSILPDAAFSNGELNAKNIPDFGSLLKAISKATNTICWRQYHRASFMTPLKKAYCRRRDNDDTDKAIYRMCCVGLVDDVTIEYLDNDKHKYTLRVVKRPNGAYYDCLQSFFEKYYSVAQSQQLVQNARNHGAQTEIDNCLGYLTKFVYEKLEDKRRRAIDDMQEACEGGIRRGDAWLKDFIHLYFNSKYAKDVHNINGVNYSLRQDIRQPNRGLVMKYIDVVNVDPSGAVVDNVKHLYGAVLIILRDQLSDELGTAILYLLRAYCLSFLSVGDNETLKDEFRSSYWKNGLMKMINADDGYSPYVLRNFITNEYNVAILTNARDECVKQFVSDMREEIALTIGLKSIKLFSDKYTE